MLSILTFVLATVIDIHPPIKEEAPIHHPYPPKPVELAKEKK